MADFRRAAWLPARHALREMGRWAARRRGTMADQFLRGASYGAGTAVTGLVALWVRTRL